VTGSDPTPTFTRTPTIKGTATRTPTATRTFTRTPTPIGGASPNNAQFVSQSVPAQMTAGTQVQVSVTMKNTGVNTWTEALGYRLASRNPPDNVTWGVGRVLLGPTESIASNQQKTFTFTVTAPSTPGNYNFQWQMIREGVGSFGALSTNVVVNVVAPAIPPYKGDFVSQSVPSQMIMGHQYQVSVTMKNGGSNTWTAAENYRLGSTNPTDNVTWGLGRVFLDAGDAIATNQQKTFTFTVTAPTTAGQYNFQWWMVRDGFTYFGTPSTNVVVDVVSTAVAPYASQFVSQSVPTSMSPGQHVQVSVTMKNVGTNTWTAAESYRLGSTNPTDNVTWGLGRVLLGLTDAIATGDSKTFTFTVTAPSAPGQYNFQWWVVRDGVIYFGVPSDNVVVTVG
jgi:Ig-like domain-containing protein